MSCHNAFLLYLASTSFKELVSYYAVVLYQVFTLANNTAVLRKCP